MTDDHLNVNEAKEFGAKLEALCRDFSSKQQEFLKMALRLAAADLWARSSEPPSESAIRDLIVDIQQAGAAHAISLNPLPMPLDPGGPLS